MQVYVSLWSADLLALGDAVDLVDPVVDGYHIDVFDGHNVQELLFGPDLVVALRQRTTRLIDIHLNVEDPNLWAQRFIAAGADMVTVQTGASPDIEATLDSIRGQGAQPSLGLELHETTDHAADLFGKIDRLLLMGTAIGIKGADLDRAAPNRIRQLVIRREQAGRSVTDLPIFVDGGIRDRTVRSLAEAGADGVIPGSLVFGAADPVGAIHDLHRL